MAAGQRRARRPRSTRGCRTCRIRHLKCDEYFPCRRCLSAGWQCDGPRLRADDHCSDLVFHHEKPDTNRRSDVKPRGGPSPSTWLADAQERRAFEFYIHKAGPLLSSVLDADFWSSLVPRLAQSDATVRYSMLAISHLCEHPIRSEIGGSIRINPLDRQHVASLQWQARALSIEKCQQSQIDTSMLILKCILLSCQEFQQNNFRNGWKLTRIAFTMLSPMMTSGCRAQYNSTAASDEVVKTIIPIMTRNTSLLFSSWDPSERCPAYTTNVSEIEATVFSYLCMVFASIKDMHLVNNRMHVIKTEDSMTVRIQELKSVLRTLQANIVRRSSNQPQQQPSRSQALREYCSVGIQWLNVLCQLINQSLKENDFLKVILDETKKLRSAASVVYPVASRTTYFNSFIISPPAYFVTIFTKSSQMRLEALSLLKDNLQHDSNADLIAIVGTTAQIKDDFNGDIETNNVYQIYYGSKDRERLMCDTYNESTATV